MENTMDGGILDFRASLTWAVSWLFAGVDYFDLITGRIIAVLTILSLVVAAGYTIHRWVKSVRSKRIK